MQQANETITRNYREDFPLLLSLKDAQGEQLTLPADADFTLRFTTETPCREYRAGRKGGEYYNCHEAEDGTGRLHVIFCRHGLGPGPLECVLEYEADDACFPGGRRRMVVLFPTGVTLTTSPSGLPAAAEVEAAAPYALLTAYDIALREGYTGSKEDYAAALAAMPKAVETAETTAGAYVRDHEALGTLIEKCETLGEDIAEGYRAEKAALDLRVEQWQGDVDRMQPRLSSSETVAVNPDSTLTVTEAAEKALFIKMWNSRCIYYYEKGPLVAGRYNEQTGFFELNGLTDITYEQAIEIFIRPVDLSSAMYNFNNTPQRTHLPPYMHRSNQNYQIGANFFHGTNMESIFLPGCVALGYWDNHKLRSLTLTGIKESRVLMYKPALERFRWHWAGNFSVAYRPRISLYVEGSPLLDWESYNQLITGQWDGTGTITLRVCAAAYAKITGDTSVAEVAALSAEEAEKWRSLADKAAAKNIVIAKG